MSSARVAVITGFHNRGALLDRSLRSLLDQRYDDYQVVLFDDGSTDDTQTRLAGYNDPRLVKIHHPHSISFVRGLIDAIDRTDSEFIAIHGSGDVSLPDRLARQVELFDSRLDVGVAGCWYRNIIAETGLCRERRPNADGMTLSRLRRGNIFSHGEVMFRRRDYLRAGGYRPEFTFCQDYDLWLRLIRLTRFATVPEFLYDRYVQFSDGVTYQPDKFIRQKRYAMLARRLSTLNEEQQKPLRAQLAAQGPEALIPLDDPELQRAVLLAAGRLIAFGNLPQAQELAGKYLRHPIYRQVFRTGRAVLGSRAGTTCQQLLRRVAGMQSWKST